MPVGAAVVLDECGVVECGIDLELGAGDFGFALLGGPEAVGDVPLADPEVELAVWFEGVYLGEGGECEGGGEGEDVHGGSFGGMCAWVGSQVWAGWFRVWCGMGRGVEERRGAPHPGPLPADGEREGMYHAWFN